MARVKLDDEVARKTALITHVEGSLANDVKRLADEAEMTASAYIRKVLRDHVASPAVQKISAIRRGQ